MRTLAKIVGAALVGAFGGALPMVLLFATGIAITSIDPPEFFWVDLQTRTPSLLLAMGAASVAGASISTLAGIAAYVPRQGFSWIRCVIAISLATSAAYVVTANLSASPKVDYGKAYLIAALVAVGTGIVLLYLGLRRDTNGLPCERELPFAK